MFSDLIIIITSTCGVFLALVASPTGCIEINNNYSKLHLAAAMKKWLAFSQGISGFFRIDSYRLIYKKI